MRFDQQESVFGGERAIARLLDVGDQHRLRRVALHRYAAATADRCRSTGRSRNATIDGDSRSGDDVGQLRHVGGLEAAHLVLFDLTGAEHADRHAAGLTFGGGRANQRHG